jgi:hypothetical protein
MSDKEKFDFDKHKDIKNKIADNPPRNKIRPSFKLNLTIFTAGITLLLATYTIELLIGFSAASFTLTLSYILILCSCFFSFKSIDRFYSDKSKNIFSNNIVLFVISLFLILWSCGTLLVFTINRVKIEIPKNNELEQVKDIKSKEDNSKNTFYESNSFDTVLSDGGEVIPTSNSFKTKLIKGKETIFQSENKTLRTYFAYQYVCIPTNDNIEAKARAVGCAYYGLFFTKAKSESKLTTEVFIEESINSKTGELNYSEVGSTEVTYNPISVYIKNTIVKDRNTISIIPTLGSLLNASGGPGISMSTGPIGLDMSFPDASISNSFSMGLYKWEKVVEKE